MNALSLFFSSSGRLAPRPFAYGVLGVYVASFLTQPLLAPGMAPRGGLWAFLIAQLILTWCWYALHAKRLRDADRGTGSAVGLSVVYLLALVLLLLVFAFVVQLDAQSAAEQAASTQGPASTFIGLMLIVIIFGILYNAPIVGWTIVVLVFFLALAFLPFFVAIGYSVWAATRPSATAAAALLPAG